MPAPTNAEIAYQQSGLLDRWTLYTTQLRDWLGGVADGGPNGDGAYPLQDVTGQTFLVPCMAAWSAKVDSITDPLTGLQATVNDGVTAAQAASTAAQAAQAITLTYRDAAQSASGDASMYATNSANSAAAALSSKDAAATSETNAAASASAAATSETNAATSATNAAASENTASNDAVAADQSAQAAAASAQQASTYAAGRLTYIGTWDVSGGALPAIGNKGDFYAITGTATINGVEYANGDMAVSDGTTGFNKIDNTDKVTSVAGLIGTISVTQMQTALNLGTAAYQPTTAFATAAQGAAADAAMPRAGGAFTGSVSATNLSGTNTGDQDLSGLMPKSGGAFTGSITVPGTTTITALTVGTMANVFTDLGGTLKVSGDMAYRYVNSPSVVRIPRIFIQSADPGAASADGDLWLW